MFHFHKVNIYFNVLGAARTYFQELLMIISPSDFTLEGTK